LSRARDIEILTEALALECGPDPDEGTDAKCRLCRGTFALRLVNGDWTLDRLAP
jgi:hypothetical protein